VYHTPLCINASVESAETATKYSNPGCRVKNDSNWMYTKNTFNCICFNARSLRNKMSDLMALVEALNPDVIANLLVLLRAGVMKILLTRNLDFQVLICSVLIEYMDTVEEAFYCMSSAT